VRRAAFAVVLVALLTAPAAARAAAPESALLAALPDQYRQAVVAHDAALAARLRTETALLAAAPEPAAVHARLARLAAAVGETREQLQPWPLASSVARLASAAGRGLGPPLPVPARPYAQLRAAIERAASGGVAAGLDAAALAERLGSAAPPLDTALWSPSAARTAAARARSALDSAQQALGDVQVSRATVVTDAAILVFREGLEAVLILAAITASFVGARAHLRRTVLLGALAGLGATVVTWLAAQLVVQQLGGDGRRLEAVSPGCSRSPCSCS